jgi:hypothetical protein
VIRVELGTRPGASRAVYVRVTDDAGTPLLSLEGPREVALVALIEWPRGLTDRGIGK